MSDFLKEMRSEARVRMEQYKQERAELEKAAERIAQLDALIAEAEAEFGDLCSRCSAKEEANAPK